MHTNIIRIIKYLQDFSDSAFFSEANNLSIRTLYSSLEDSNSLLTFTFNIFITEAGRYMNNIFITYF